MMLCTCRRPWVGHDAEHVAGARPGKQVGSLRLLGRLDEARGATQRTTDPSAGGKLRAMPSACGVSYHRRRRRRRRRCRRRRRRRTLLVMLIVFFFLCCKVCRTFTFGEKGVSNGQFFRSHLARIQLNTVAVDWASYDTSRLVQVGWSSLIRCLLGCLVGWMICACACRSNLLTFKNSSPLRTLPPPLAFVFLFL